MSYSLLSGYTASRRPLQIDLDGTVARVRGRRKEEESRNGVKSPKAILKVS